MWLPRRVSLVVGLVLVLCNPVSDRASPPLAHAAAIPPGLPTHFGIGLAAAPDDTGIYGWMPNSNIPWDYAYQYLSAGVNTGHGWETWDPDGQFALWYAQGAASHGYIPVFTYYDLLQSTTGCGSSCGEAQRDLYNLNDRSVMAAYYANFRTLMQRLGPGTYTTPSGNITGFGKTVIVHVEPDLSGYAEQAVLDNTHCYNFCTAQGNNPADLNAAVATTGDPDVAGFPNTYQGFNWALIHLRDLYAPNVLLAFHLSTWSTLYDAPSSTDPASLGQEAGSFAAQSGVETVPSGSGTYDLLFNDVSDRDAGSDPSRWWDRLNVTLPNFHQWEQYVNAAAAATSRSVIVWQIPQGNQYFDTDNNTAGHYQDNRAEYFFGHIPELVQNGIIGLLFGAGPTQHTDAQNDGVTNPPSFCTTAGTSSGQICNNHTSTVADDDGGYIRMEAQQYYASPYSLTPPSTVSVPVVSGWNLLDVPMQNTGITSAASLASSLDSSLGARDSRVVATYTGGRFSVYVPGYSAGLSLAPWQGVMVLSQSSGSWKLTGNTYTSGTAVPLAPGWNLVAAPYPASGISTSNIVSEASGCTVREIATYANGAYQIWQPGQIAMTVSSTGGMWVQCAASQTWTPS